jgi:uncharacterized protein (TIGR02246 family)
VAVVGEQVMVKRSALTLAWLWVAAAVMLLLTGDSRRQNAQAQDVAASINEIWNRYSSFYNSGDIDNWISLWTDDGIQMPPGSPPALGKEEIRKRNKAVLLRFTFDLRITNDEIGAADEWAFARGTYNATLTAKEGGKRTRVDGKYLTIFKRQSDGSWKIHRDIFNSND